MGLNWKNIFTRPKHSMDPSAPFTHVQGDIFAPGAGDLFAYVPEKADPTFEATTIPARPLYGFTPLLVTQPPMMYQGLSLAPSPQQGYQFQGLTFNDLMSQENYPDVPEDLG